jgi:phosphonate transport system permease protein
MSKAISNWKPSPTLSWAGLGIVLSLLSLLPTGLFQREVFNPNGWPQLWRFIAAMAHPNLSLELLKITWEATIVTLAYAICGTFLTVLIGLVVGSLCSEVWWETILGRRGRWVYWPLRLLLAIPRAIHELIWGLFLVGIWGLDPLVAIVAIAIPFGAITAKVFSEILDDTPRKPLEALQNSGVAAIPALLYGLYPAALSNLISYSFYRFECSLRSAAVLGIIGAGGLGYQILISLQSLKYEELWTFFYALILLNGLIDAGSAWLRNRFEGSAKTNRFIPWFCGGTITTIACFHHLNPDYSRLFSARSQRLLSQLLSQVFPPDWTIVPQLFQPAIDTIAMSVVAIVIATLGGMGFAFLAARTFLRLGWQFGCSSWLARLLLLVSRAVPAPIWALVIVYVMFPGILPGAIALGLHNLGILGRLMAEVIENVDRRPLEALKTTGATNGGIFLYGWLPMAMPRFLAYGLYRWEVCMRETVIVGLVGAGGLGRLLTEQLTSFDYRSLVVTLGVFLVLTFGVDWLSSLARRDLR